MVGKAHLEGLVTVVVDAAAPDRRCGLRAHLRDRCGCFT